MKTLLAITTVLLLLSAYSLSPAAPQQAHAHLHEPHTLPVHDIEAPVAFVNTFTTIDITIDPQGKPMGAFQFELTSDGEPFIVVGVEAGGHPAFDHGRPPYFDRVVQQQNTDKIVLAEYARPELAIDRLPAQAVRVATVHIMFTPRADREPPQLELELTAVGDAEGNRIDAQASINFRNPQRPQ